MKRSTLRRLLVLALCLTLVTCTLVGGTLAKYTTSASGADDARVAKWGVVITADTTNDFAKTYAKASSGTTSFENTVVSTVEVVAPGTGSTLGDVTISGTPEVAVQVDYAATLTLSNWTVDNADYCPIIFTVEGQTYKIGDTGITDVATLKSAVEEAIADESGEYAAGTNLSTIGADAPSVSWEWPFSTSTANDVKDTALGNAAAASTGEDTDITIELSLTTTVTQID